MNALRNGRVGRLDELIVILLTSTMLVLLSPAKTMDLSSPPPELPSTTPRGIQEADELAKQMSSLSELQLKDLLKVSSNLARQAP